MFGQYLNLSAKIGGVWVSTASVFSFHQKHLGQVKGSETANFILQGKILNTALVLCQTCLLLRGFLKKECLSPRMILPNGEIRHLEPNIISFHG
jgi:hypothetical protein